MEKENFKAQMTNVKSMAANVLRPKILSFGFWISFVIWILAFGFFASVAHAATLQVSPTTGTFTAGSTFDVSVFLDTEGEAVNALEASLKFPADKIQVVLPSTGQSIIDIWTAQPKFNNQTGRIDLQGGIPGGANVSNGLITTITFRVKATGSATLQFLDNSKVLLHDGKGTDVLYQTQNGVYQLVLPPPAGPIVASETNPAQSNWYARSSAVFTWANEEEVEGYSYVLNVEPIDIPDDTSEGIRNNVAYKNLANGVHYFHIKALRRGVWGGVTHFAVQVDALPPAEFPIEISPAKKTTSREPAIRFQTTDAHSGISHYELKIIPVDRAAVNVFAEYDQLFFVEVQSPFVFSEAELGKYDVIVRAHDKAGNFLDVTERLEITDGIFQFVGGRGIEIKNVITVSWTTLWIMLVTFIIVVVFAAWSTRKWHNTMHTRGKGKEWTADVEKKLRELKDYQKKYGTMHSVLLILFLGAALFSTTPVFAQETSLSPPFVTTISKNISNEEIFYVGGKTDAADVAVVIYMQNLQTGETTNRQVKADKRGDWFYRHDTLLSSGDYLLWTQSKLGELVSPPGPQIQLSVQATAIQFGASRLSYEVLYLGVSIFLFLILLAVGGYAVFHARVARRKHKEFQKELREAEESIRRGFAVLRRDIQAELALLKKGKRLSEEQKKQEAQLLRDLAWAESYIGKEVWDVAETEHFD